MIIGTENTGSWGTVIWFRFKPDVDAQTREADYRRIVRDLNGSQEWAEQTLFLCDGNDYAVIAVPLLSNGDTGTSVELVNKRLCASNNIDAESIR